MWFPEALFTREAVLDLTSSEQGCEKVLQLFFDDVLFGNAISETNWVEEAFQTLVCESCGTESCEPGNWLVVRNAGRFAMFIPYFQGMMTDNPFDLTEYAPPHYILSRGAPVLSNELYNRFRRIISGMPRLEHLPKLRGFEAKRILQIETVHNMLGLFPAEIKVREDHALACSDGDLSDRLAQATKAIQELSDDCLVRLRPMATEAQPIVVYLGDRSATEWLPIALEGDQVYLVAAPGFVLEKV